MKPGIPKGTRDFNPQQVQKRKYIFDTIRRVFQKYGYQPIETPVMENLNTLTGKYGEEGDRLLFKVLNNGDFLAKADPNALEQKNSQKLVPSICKRGLRYDLTVPFARYVVMHQNEINFPFKRYQMQPVWRADRPQKGRYQEFYQCDADVVGSSSVAYEAEFVCMLDEVFQALGLEIKILINHRKVLSAIAEVAGVEDKFTELTVSIDKLDKIGWDGVAEDLKRKEFNHTQIQSISKLFQITNVAELLEAVKGSTSGKDGLEVLQNIFTYLEGLPLQNQVNIEFTLARGLNYYTGAIFEVKALGVNMGSIAGGGRYDDLTGVFGLKDIPGVGISFGVARIYDVMEELKLFPESVAEGICLLILALDGDSHRVAFQLLHKIRLAGISADLFPEPTKMKKQMRYANQIGVPFTMIIGSNEIEKQVYTLKNMVTGDQGGYTLTELIKSLQD